MAYYTLNEYGLDRLEFTSLDANGAAVVLDTYQGAVELASWMLEGGAEDGQLPLVSILEWDEDPSPMFVPEAASMLLDIPACAAGWVVYEDGRGVTAHDGDYENDAALWESMPLPPAVLEDVENAWYELMKGELDLTEEPDGAELRLVSAMRSRARWYAEHIASEQYDAVGDPIERVDDREVARRIAAALSILQYGC